MNKLLLTLAAASAFAAFAAGAQVGKTGRGKYLTEEVAQCQECHTQRLATGQLDRSAWLKGAAPNAAPDITSGGELWKRWGENGMLQYLKTGATPGGQSAHAPMPAYKLRHEDAEAIVAYLKSLR